MSQFAPFVDAAAAIDRTNFDNTFISYYEWGEAIALGLDLTLRDRSDGKVTLDHYMRALWQKFGKPGGRMPGYVDNPYTMADLESTLAAVSGDARFASDFFARYIRGHEVVDYARLLARAGFTLRRRAPGDGFAGDLRIQDAQGRARVAGSGAVRLAGVRRRARTRRHHRLDRRVATRSAATSIGSSAPASLGKLCQSSSNAEVSRSRACFD